MSRPPYTDRSGMNRAYLARSIFAPYYRLLNELQTGEVSCIEDTPVIEWQDQIEPAFAVLHGFAAVWERVQEKRPCGLDLAPLTALANKLEQGEMLAESEVSHARAALDGCFRAYKRLPLSLIATCANTEETAIKLRAVREQVVKTIQARGSA